MSCRAVAEREQRDGLVLDWHNELEGGEKLYTAKQDGGIRRADRSCAKKEQRKNTDQRPHTRIVKASKRRPTGGGRAILQLNTSGGASGRDGRES